MSDVKSNMKHHELKTDPEPFRASWWGWKPYEIRKNDRNFKPGDQISLRETVYSGEEMQAGKPLEYTGRCLGREVTEVRTGYGIKDGWCALGVKVV